MSRSDDFVEAYRAVRRVAEGKDRTELRLLLVNELESRDLSYSNSEIEHYVTMLSKPRAKAAGTDTVEKAAARRMQDPIAPLRVIRNARKMRNLLPQFRRGRRVWFLDPDASLPPLEADLTDEARGWLARNENLPRRANPAEKVDIQLLPESGLAAEGSIEIYVGEHLIGFLNPSDTYVFRTEIETAKRGKYFLMTSGYISHDDGDRIRFFVYAQ
jgi:hypothetical protein